MSDESKKLKQNESVPSGVEEVVSPEEFELNPVSVLSLSELIFVLGEVLHNETR